MGVFFHHSGTNCKGSWLSVWFLHARYRHVHVRPAEEQSHTYDGRYGGGFPRSCQRQTDFCCLLNRERNYGSSDQTWCFNTNYHIFRKSVSLHWIQANTGRIQDFHCGEKTPMEKVYFCHYSVDVSPFVCFPPGGGMLWREGAEKWLLYE